MRNQQTLQLNNLFRLDKILEHCPPKEINLTGLVLDTDWIDQLKKLNPALKKHLDKHIGPKAVYDEKEALVNTLKIIYFRLTGQLDACCGKLATDTKQSILQKITENINLCSEGFHNRCKIVLRSFSNADSFEQPLHLVREALVEKTATQLSSEVHINNRVSRVGSTAGYGVRPINLDDKYSGAIPDETIEKALRATFERELTPWNTPSQLVDQFRSILMMHNIAHQPNFLFGIRDVRLVRELVCRFFTAELPSESDCFTLEEFTEDDIPLQRHIINWDYIEAMALRKLALTCFNPGFIIESIYDLRGYHQAISCGNQTQNEFRNQITISESLHPLLNLLVEVCNRKTERALLLPLLDRLNIEDLLSFDFGIIIRILIKNDFDDEVSAIIEKLTRPHIINENITAFPEVIATIVIELAENEKWAPLKKTQALFKARNTLPTQVAHIAIDLGNIDIVDWVISLNEIDLKTKYGGETITRKLGDYCSEHPNQWPVFEGLLPHVETNPDDPAQLGDTALTVCRHLHYCNNKQQRLMLKRLAHTLIMKKCDLYWKYSTGSHIGYTALHFAILAMELDLIAAILQANQDTILHTEKEDHLTPLALIFQQSEERIPQLFQTVWSYAQQKIDDPTLKAHIIPLVHKKKWAVIKSMQQCLSQHKEITTELAHIAINQGEIDSVDWLVSFTKIDTNTKHEDKTLTQKLGYYCSEHPNQWPVFGRLLTHVENNSGDPARLGEAANTICRDLHTCEDQQQRLLLKRLAQTLIMKKCAFTWYSTHEPYIGYTALHFAIMAMEFDLITAMLQANPEIITYSNLESKTPLELALINLKIN